MSANPEHYIMRLTAVTIPHPDRSHNDLATMAKQQLADCLAASILQMDRFTHHGRNHNGDEVHELEVFVFTREEINLFMREVADATRAHIARGGKSN